MIFFSLLLFLLIYLGHIQFTSHDVVMPPDRQPLRAPNSYNYPSTSTSSTYRTSNPSTFSSTTTNHRPKHPIGASPADIAPPISLRRNNNNNNNNKVSRFGNLGTTNRGETTTTTSGKSKLRGGTEQEKDKNGKDQSANGRGNDVVVGKSGTGVTTSSASTSNSSSSTSQSKTKSTATTSKTTMNEDPEILIIDTSSISIRRFDETDCIVAICDRANSQIYARESKDGDSRCKQEEEEREEMKE